MSLFCNLFGVCCILLAGFFAYRSTVSRWRLELHTLQTMRQTLAYLENGIRSAYLPIPTLLAEREDAFSQRLIQELQGTEITLSQAWKTAVKALPLSPREQELLCQTATELSGAEGESICRSLRYRQSCLEQSIAEQEAQLSERVQLSRAICFSASFLLIFLLIG